MSIAGGETGASNDTLKVILAFCFASGSWLLRFAVTRYFSRKDAREEKKRDSELKNLLEKDIHLHQHGHSEKKSHTL